MNYFTVGPSQTHSRLREFLDDALAADIPSISHRSPVFAELFATLRTNLQKLVGVDSTYHAFYAASGTEWMERTLQNMSTKRTLHFFGGTFGWRFWRIAQVLGREAMKVDQRPDGSYSLDDIPADADPELICLTHNETTNGTTLSDDFFTALRERFPHVPIALDAVSSAPFVSKICATADCIFFSIQKVFGLPAGLGVALVNEKQIERAREIGKTQYTGSFHSFEKFAENASRSNTPETPNVLGIYLLNRVCEDFLARGVESLTREMNEKASILYAALTKTPDVALSPLDESLRSHTTIVARAPGGSASVIERLKKESFLIHAGYGDAKETHIRIANFPAHTLENMKKLAELLVAG